jgi:hypothetical protein
VDQDHGRIDEDDAEELLRRALLDPEQSLAVALRVEHLMLADALTLVFRGRLDLSTIQTFVANGGRGAGSAVSAGELLRVPCDLDFGDTESRAEAEQAYAEQARVLRDAVRAADAVLSVWLDLLDQHEDGRVVVDRSIDLPLRLPAHRLIPLALVAPERRLTVTPVVGAATLAEGTPPMGVACAQQDITHVYPLPDDPEACLEDFERRAAEHSHRIAEQLERQELSVRRFLELSGGETPAATD